MQLSDVYRGIWEHLIAGVRDDSHPFAQLQAATCGLDGSPNIRTVALRRVSEPEKLIVFHTDLRSPKLAELGNNPRIALLALDPSRKLQARVFGTARVLRDGPIRADAWNSSSDRDLILYRTSLAPGTPINQPDDAFGETHPVAGPDEGFAHFCVVEVAVARIDWLDESAAQRPVRARFELDGDAWTSDWVAP